MRQRTATSGRRLVIVLAAVGTLAVGMTGAGAANPNTAMTVDFCTVGGQTQVEWTAVGHLSYVRLDWFDFYDNYLGSSTDAGVSRSGTYHDTTEANAVRVTAFFYGYTRKTGEYIIAAPGATCS